MGAKELSAKILAKLKKTYPDADCELKFRNPLELLIATILSAQCTDERVNKVTPELFKRFKNAKDYASSKEGELEKLIHSTGFYKNKAKNIRECCKQILEKHEGKVPDSMEALVELHGIGRKTANVILGNVFGKNEGVVVDTHVMRLSQRMGLTKNKTPEKIEADLMKIIPQKDWALTSHLLIWHGRRRCQARKPDCEGCEIKNLCPKKINAR